MRKFVARQNVERYRHLLETERDPAVRRKLESLLAEALAILDEEEESASEPPPPVTAAREPFLRRH